MDKMRQASTQREVFEYGLAAMLAQLNPERALCALRDKDTDRLDALASHGLDPQTVFLAGEISTELIKTVLRDGQGVCLVDAISHPGLANRTSVILSGLRSIVAVPLVHPSRLVLGLLYADNRIKAGAFQAPHQDWLQKLADEMVVRLLHIQRSEASSPPPIPASENAGATSEQDWAQARQQAFTHFREGRLGEAVEHLKRAAGFAAGLGATDPRWGKTLGELAEIQRQSRELVEAERHFIQAIDLLEKLGTVARHDLAPILTNLATLYFSQGNGLRAEGLYRRALEIWQGQLAQDDRRLAPLYFNLATLRRAAGAGEEARGLFGKALLIAEKAWGPDHPHSQRCRTALEVL